MQTRTPKEDNMYHVHPEEWLTAKNLVFACYAVIRGWLPIPQAFGGHFWNTSWLQDRNIGWAFVRDIPLFMLPRLSGDGLEEIQESRCCSIIPAFLSWYFVLSSPN